MSGILTPTHRRFYERSYTEVVLATDPIAHWTLGERFGSTAYDGTQNHFNGTITGATLGQPGIGDGLTSMLFDGANDYVDIFSAGFAADFDGNEGTTGIWARVLNVGVWTDGTLRKTINIGNAGANIIYLARDNVNNTFYYRHKANNVAKVVIEGGLAITDWMFIAITYSRAAGANGEIRAYRDGVQIGATLTNQLIFGAINDFGTAIGAKDEIPSEVWSGWLAHAAVWNRPLALAEIEHLYRARWTQ